jgi:GDPmannose 4,6-dehydratase
MTDKLDSVPCPASGCRLPAEASIPDGNGRRPCTIDPRSINSAGRTGGGRDGEDVKRALLTGVTGQDGAYLSKLLLDEGYEVFGLARGAPTADSNLHRLAILDRVRLLRGDVADLAGLTRLIREIQPQEVFNLAGPSYVPGTWDQPVSAAMVGGIGALNVLEALRVGCPGARFYQASSSEMFGAVEDAVLSEATPHRPGSPYAAAKSFAYWMTVSYRDGFGVHASNGITFNHESPLRRPEFVTRKVTIAASRIKLGLQHELRLGNIEAVRDWGHAKDYVRAMWLMLQQDVPDDYVIATGRTASVRELCGIAFDYLGLDADKYIVIDETLVRPADPACRCGDPSKARRRLGWAPSVSLEDLIREMIDVDLERERRQL